MVSSSSLGEGKMRRVNMLCVPQSDYLFDPLE